MSDQTITLAPRHTELASSFAPRSDINIRPGTMEDLPFIDRLQDMHTSKVGFLPMKALEGKIRLGHVLVAEESGRGGEGASGREEIPSPDRPLTLPAVSLSNPSPPRRQLGYLMGNDQYAKRDDLGIIYQMNVLPGKQRGLIGASLLKAQFERSAWGCKLYCCWCAQDLEVASRFWEACGFVPLAFRTGARKKGKNGAPRMHIFWQKRIREGDTTTPWWFPSQTAGGAMMEDRLVFPIPPGMHWSDAMPVILPGMDRSSSQLPAPKTKSKTVKPKPVLLNGIGIGVMRYSDPALPKVEKPKAEKAPRQKVKNDPKYIAAARELRDRWLEQQDQLVLPAPAKHDVRRMMGTNQGDVTSQIATTLLGTLALPEAA